MPVIGTNKRYEAYYDERMSDKILQRLAEDNPLQSLTPAERQEDTLPVTRDPHPKPCRAWVRFGPHATRVTGVVVVWNDVACGIEFTVGEQQLRCWVWTNAVSAVTGPIRRAQQ